MSCQPRRATAFVGCGVEFHDVKTTDAAAFSKSHQMWNDVSGSFSLRVQGAHSGRERCVKNIHVQTHEEVSAGVRIDVPRLWIAGEGVQSSPVSVEIGQVFPGIHE